MKEFNRSLDILQQIKSGAIKKECDITKIKDPKVKIKVLEDKKYFTDKENVRKMRRNVIMNAFKKKLLAMLKSLLP